MSGIKSINEVLVKKGENNLLEFLSSNVRITEKYDAHRISFEKNHKGKIFFFNKGAKPLNIVDRTLSDLYEPVIEHFQNILSEVSSQIPAGLRFGFYYFPTKKPLNTYYSSLPKNRLVLTDVSYRKNGKLVESVQEQNVFDRWAKLLMVSADQELYHGKLDESAIAHLLEIAKADGGVAALFESKSLSRDHGLLQETGQPIDSIVIRSLDSGELIKIDDHRGETVISEKRRNHLFDLLLLEIHDFVQKHGFKKSFARGKNADERYLSLVCECFNDFVKRKGNDFLTLQLEKPAFMKNLGNFNQKWIRNEDTLKLLEAEHRYEYLLSIFLANLRKEKNPSGLLNQAVLESFNARIREVQELIQEEDEFSFLEFNAINESEKDEKLDDSIRDMRLIALCQKAFDQEKGKVKEGDAVNVMVGDMSIICNQHIAKAEDLNNANGLKTVLIHVSTKSKSNSELSYDETTTAKALQQVVETFPTTFISHRVILTKTIEDVMKSLGSLVPQVIAIEKSDDAAQVELKSIRSFGNLLGVPEKLELVTFNIKKDEIHAALDGGNLIDFNKLVPAPVSAYYTEFQSKYRASVYTS